MNGLAACLAVTCFCFASFSAIAADSADDPVKACPGAAEFYQVKMETVNRSEVARKPPVLPELRKKLLAWAKTDQQARKGITAETMSDPAKSKRIARRLQAVDELSYRRIKDVIDEYGFPTATMVAPDGAGSAFLLVQHQDRHPEFQQFVLEIMSPWVKRGEVDGESFALLTDRVLVAQKKPQRYGSQFRSLEDGSMEIQPVEDPERLDERRAEAGMPPMSIYRCLLEQNYHTTVK